MSKTADYINYWRANPAIPIREEIRQQERIIYEFRKDRLSKPVTNVKAVHNARKNIARLRTILKERQMLSEISNGQARPDRLRSKSFQESTGRVNNREATEAAMSIYRFAWNFKSSALKNADFPVEVRKPNFGLVKRGVSSKPFRLHPGEYYVTATFPAGKEVFYHLNVQDSKRETIVLESASNDLSTNSSEEIERFFVICSAHLTGLPSGHDESSRRLTVTEARLRLWEVDVFHKKAIDITSKFLLPKSGTEDTLNKFRIVGKKTVIVAQLLVPNGLTLNTVLPVWQNTECFFSVCKQSNSSLTIEPHVLSVEANALLRYEQYHHFKEAAAMLTSNMLIFPRFLDGPKKDPVSAAIMAYAILRYDDVNRLETWAARLSDDPSQLPDGSVIYGEYLARMGKHERALEAFISLAKRGLPLFSIGLKYVLERLSVYVLPNRYALNLERVRQARVIIDRLSDLAEHVDYSQPYLTFSGINPLEPNGQLLENATIREGIGLGLQKSRDISTVANTE